MIKYIAHNEDDACYCYELTQDGRKNALCKYCQFHGQHPHCDDCYGCLTPLDDRCYECNPRCGRDCDCESEEQHDQIMQENMQEFLQNPGDSPPPHDP